MKNLVRISLLAIVILFAGCQKNENEVKPKTIDGTLLGTSDSLKRALNVSSVKKVVAVANLSNAILKLAISKDTVINMVDHDQTIVVFNPQYHTIYNRMEDARYFFGREQTVSLANLSSDNIPLAIGAFPYFPNESIKLTIGLLHSGNYVFRVLSTQNMPTGTHVWVHDALKRDSTIIDTKTFHFVADVTKPKTFSNRFALTWK
jgi:hypothetical protein